jgi:hypothetical protein
MFSSWRDSLERDQTGLYLAWRPHRDQAQEVELHILQMEGSLAKIRQGGYALEHAQGSRKLELVFFLSWRTRLRIIQAGLDARSHALETGKVGAHLFRWRGSLAESRQGCTRWTRQGAAGNWSYVFSRLRDSLAARQGRLHWTTGQQES